MPRLKHFVTGLGSGYLLLLANTVSTLVSLPLALSYLGRTEFTIWLVVLQTGTYLSLIDLGTSGSGIRLLVDYKDTPNSGEYGSLIKSMWLIQLVQAAFIFLGGMASAGVLSTLLKNIPAELVDEFRMLWIWQVTFLAMSFAFRLGIQLLHAHQRIDVANYGYIVSVVLNFIVLVVCLRAGLRLYSFIIAQGLATLCSLLIANAACFVLRLWPPSRASGRVTRTHLRQLFTLAGEFFLMILGVTIITGSQSLLLTRLHSLDSALVWSIMTKPFTLCHQIVARFIGGATTAFSEMLVRQETDRLWRRYRSMCELSLLAAGYFGLLIAFGNDALVKVWTKKPISWEGMNNWLLAVWLILLINAGCHTSLLLHSKRTGILKWIVLAEAVTVIVLAFAIVPDRGLNGMLVCSVLCTALFSASCGTWEISRLSGRPFLEIAIGWLAPLARFLVIMLPLGLTLAILTTGSPWLRLLGCALPLALAGPCIALRFCLPKDVREEVIARCPGSVRGLICALLGHHGDVDR
jgi:O-antigen/teichoic acid export membrane protein